MGPGESGTLGCDPVSWAGAWARIAWCGWVAAVAGARLGTNLAALSEPQPLATSKPLAAGNPGTRTVLPSGVGTELLPLITSAMPARAPCGPSTRYSTGLIGPTLALFAWGARARMPAH